MQASAEGSDFNCANRPEVKKNLLGKITAENIDLAVATSCAGMTSGGLNCTATCTKAMAGFAACAHRGEASIDDMEMYCYLRAKYPDGCGLMFNIMDNLNVAKGVCDKYTGLGTLKKASARLVAAVSSSLLITVATFFALIL